MNVIRNFKNEILYEIEYKMTRGKILLPIDLNASQLSNQEQNGYETFKERTLYNLSSGRPKSEVDNSFYHIKNKSQILFSRILRSTFPYSKITYTFLDESIDSF
jgi:hypothetical protein